MAGAAAGAEPRGMVHDAPGTRREPVPTPPFLRSPADAIASIPHLLGFVPRNSAVVLLADGRGDLALSCRIDLPDPGDLESWAREFADVLARAAGRGRIGPAQPPRAATAESRDALIVAWAPIRRERDVRTAIPALTGALDERGIRVLDQLWTWGQRWRSLTCRDTSCCPPGGRRVGSAARTRARSAFLGREVAASREDLEATLRPRDPEAAAEVVRLLAGMPPVEEETRDIAISQAHDVLAGAGGGGHPAAGPAAAQVAMALAALRDTRVRDTLIWDLLRAPRGDWSDMRCALEHIVRCAPPGDVAAAATVLGILHWQRGDGTRASIALRRARDDDPTYSLAALVDASVAAGLPPGEWLAGLRGLTREACRRAG